MQQQTSDRLTEEQLRFFHREGYLLVEDLLTEADLNPLIDEITRMLDAKAQELQQSGELAQTFPEADFKTRLALIAGQNMDAARKIIKSIEGMTGGGIKGKEMFATITHPKIIAVIEALLGTKEIVGSSVYRIRPKVPKYDRGVVPWHQDSGYFLEHCDSEMIITCWLPLVDATVENGCLLMLPRTHNQGIVRHHTGGNAGFLEIKEENLPEGNAVTVPTPFGGAIFFTNRTPHCSETNDTDHVRWSLDLRYQSADAPNNIDQEPETFTLDRPAVEIACYPPEADFVIQSVKHPEKVIGTVEAFQALRESYERRFTQRSVVAKRWAEAKLTFNPSWPSAGSPPRPPETGPSPHSGLLNSHPRIAETAYSGLPKAPAACLASRLPVAV